MNFPFRSSHSLPAAMLVLLIGSSAAFTASAVAPPADASPSPAAEAASASKDGAPFDLTDPERIATGKKRFNSNCAAYCHGAEGAGGKTPPFKGNKNFNVKAALEVITNGRRGSDVMPAWGKGFKPEEIWELVAYIQFLSTQPPAP